MNVAEIREAIADRLSTVGVRSWGWVPDNVSPPCAVVVPQSPLTYSATFGNASHTVPFVILLVAGGVSDRSAQATLDRWISQNTTGSVVDALEADPELGTSAQTIRVTEMRSYGTTEIGSARYFSCELVVEVIASGG